MKQFLLFGGCSYYPSGGWGDFVDSFDTQAEATAKGEELEILDDPSFEWWHVVNMLTGEKVAQYGRACYGDGGYLVDLAQKKEFER